MAVSVVHVCVCVVFCFVVCVCCVVCYVVLFCVLRAVLYNLWRTVLLWHGMA